MTHQEPSTFRRRLKAFLANENIDPSEFAPKIGRSVDAVKRYIAGTSAPKVDVILEMGIAYPHWSLKYLFTGIGEPYKEIETKVVEDPRPNEKENLQRWMALRARIQTNLNTLPLDGFEVIFSKLLEEVGELLEENQKKIEQLEPIFKTTLDP